MSTITLELPDAFAETLATPEGMARAHAAILAAFPELDTRTNLEQALDDLRKQEKALWQARETKLLQQVQSAKTATEQAI